MHTNQLAKSSAPLSLDEMSRLICEHKATPVGFIISREAYEALVIASEKMTRGYTFGGVKIMIDPSMPETEFEAVFTNDAWQKRLAEIARLI
ncbi:MAG: hypothetical protein Q7N50_09955 [Armatimonadota bacterium]|nr:hypothetical protein [Armatimonadota bacterium]